MTVGKIIIESGDYKAVFCFENEKCKLTFEPSLDLKSQEKTDEQIFVENTVRFIANYLISDDE